MILRAIRILEIKHVRTTMYLDIWRVFKDGDSLAYGYMES
jgi:hypothetical protein